MGPLGQILVTGAAGFIGRSVVAEARARGLRVVAVTRRNRRPEWDSDEGITVINADLGDPDAINRLRRVLDECETVVHAAGSLSGDARKHLRDTLTATQMVLAAMQGTPVARLVLLSSIAVYDMTRLPQGGTLTEDTPLEDSSTARDAYTHAKLRQEEMCREAASQSGFDLWLLRPGAVFGPGRVWNGHLGLALGPALVRIGGAAQIPVCHVANCARTVVSAAQNSSGDLPAVNIFDRDLPSRAQYVHMMQRSGWPQYVVPLPFAVMRAAATLSAPLGSDRPGLLQPRILHARMGRFTYDITALTRRFGAPPEIAFTELFADALESGA